MTPVNIKDKVNTLCWVMFNARCDHPITDPIASRFSTLTTIRQQVTLILNNMGR